MGRRILNALSINQMLFLSHLVLVSAIIFGMSLSRYNSEWNSRIEHATELAEMSLSPMLTDISLAVSGRNYANLTMPSIKQRLLAIEKLDSIDIKGVSDYSSQPVGVRFWRGKGLIWRTDVDAGEVVAVRGIV